MCGAGWKTVGNKKTGADGTVKCYKARYRYQALSEIKTALSRKFDTKVLLEKFFVSVVVNTNTCTCNYGFVICRKQ